MYDWRKNFKKFRTPGNMSKISKKGKIEENVSEFFLGHLVI